MSQRGDGLHLDGVPVLQGVVQDAWRVHHLPAQVAVVHVADKERLGGEGVGLDLHVRPGHLVHEAGLPHVGKAADQEGARVGVDGGQTGEMLPHLGGHMYMCVYTGVIKAHHGIVLNSPYLRSQAREI